MDVLPRDKWVAFLMVALAAAVFGYIYWEASPLLNGPVLRRGSTPAGRTEGLVVLTMPIACFLVWRASLHPFLFLHLSVYTMLLLVGVRGDEGHSSPFAGAGRDLTPGIIGIEVAVLAIGVVVAAARGAVFPWRRWAGVVAVLLGLTAGSTTWAMLMPLKVRSQAAELAEGGPYCIYAAGRPAGSWFSLSAFGMYDPEVDGWHDNFHGLLAVGALEGTRYFNWSYRVNRFVEIDRKRVERLRLSQDPLC